MTVPQRHGCIATWYGALGDTDIFLNLLKAVFTEREYDALEFIRADLKEYQIAGEAEVDFQKMRVVCLEKN